eukprot:scaffold25736_cov117-Cylindrotheca_fusiformis.AAC.8
MQCEWTAERKSEQGTKNKRFFTPAKDLVNDKLSRNQAHKSSSIAIRAAPYNWKRFTNKSTTG